MFYYFAAKDGEIEELQDTIKELKKQIERLEGLLDDKSAQIENLKEQCDKYEKEINRLENKIEEKK